MSKIVSEIEAGQTKLWSHSGPLTAMELYSYLQRFQPEILRACVGEKDFREIRDKGLPFFNEHLRGLELFAWGDAKDGYVPRLNVEESSLYIFRYPLTDSRYIHGSVLCRITGR